MAGVASALRELDGSVRGAVARPQLTVRDEEDAVAGRREVADASRPEEVSTATAVRQLVDSSTRHSLAWPEPSLAVK